MTHSWKNKYKDRYSIKKRSHQHYGRQQGRNVDKKTDNSRNRNDMRKSGGKRNHNTRRNTKK